MSTFTVYVTQQNSDLTEGKGGMRDVSYWDNEGDAVQDAQGRGVMGVGTGDVVMRSYRTLDDLSGKVEFVQKRVYGYRKDPFGKWSDGFIDNREFSDVTQSDEYIEFLRLSKKYGGK